MASKCHGQTKSAATQRQEQHKHKPSEGAAIGINGGHVRDKIGFFPEPGAAALAWRCASCRKVVCVISACFRGFISNVPTIDEQKPRQLWLHTRLEFLYQCARATGASEKWLHRAALVLCTGQAERSILVGKMAAELRPVRVGTVSTFEVAVEYDLSVCGGLQCFHGNFIASVATGGTGSAWLVGSARVALAQQAITKVVREFSTWQSKAMTFKPHSVHEKSAHPPTRALCPKTITWKTKKHLGTCTFLAPVAVKPHVVVVIVPGRMMGCVRGYIDQVDVLDY